MKLEELKEAHLEEIVGLYEKHCGFGREFTRAMYQHPALVLEHLREQGWEEYRIGSKWDQNSKIYFRTDFEGNLSVGFEPNFDPKFAHETQYEAALSAGDKFEEATMNYLEAQASKQ